MTMRFTHMSELDLTGKRVLIRADLNVPLNNRKITSTARIDAILPTITAAIEQKVACVMLMSHLGRPEEGVFDAQYSLAPVADYLSLKLGKALRIVHNYVAHGVQYSEGELLILENVRFNPGEAANTTETAKAYGALCDVFVMDAFGTAHRAQASTYGVAQYAPIACAGPLLVQELKALNQALKQPKSPVVAIVGGSKVSSKLPVLQALAKTCDQIIVGGGIANTFLAAQGLPVGDSLYEPDLIEAAKALLSTTDIPLPCDVVVAKTICAAAQATIKPVSEVQADEKILDVGPQTSAQFTDILAKAGTIIWNGPVGVFELPPFAQGTEALAQAIANSSAFSLAGGGDTLAAIEQFHVENAISYISTGGGAFLEYVEGHSLPAVAMLEQRAQ